MKLATQLYFSVGILFLIALGAAGLTLWSAQRAEHHLDRMNFAHQQYEGYLSLSNHTYQLFKQFGDAMLIGDLDRGTGESELMSMIRSDIEQLRSLTGREIDFVEDHEMDSELNELGQLARIERQLESLLTEYQQILDAKERSPFIDDWERLSRMLDESIDQDFRQLISAALEDEAEEVSDVRAQAAENLRLFRSLAGVFAAIACIAAALGLLKLLREIKAPVNRLLEGVYALERGELGFRIDPTGPIELRGVANAFNRMADGVASRERARAEANASLESQVEDRTRELNQLLDTLKESEENRRRLLADVSHELRTPLTIIRGEADIALRGRDKAPEVYREALGKCRESAVHTARLVDDLLFIARSEGHEVRLVLADVDLASFVPQVVDECRGLVPENQDHSLSFQSDLQEATLRADENRIRQVIVILIENAIRYGGNNVDVRLLSAPEGFMILVSDDGPGMTEKELKNAFVRLFRGSNAAERYAGGAGLGLPVAKAIVEAHEGELLLSSDPGHGVRVSVTLPKRRLLRAVQ